MALTWRNVDAPDFGRSMEGYRGFSAAFGDAIGGLDRGLARYDSTLDEAANNKLLAQFAGLQTADAARAQLATLSSDPNFRRINAATIGAVSARPGQLINEALAGTNLEAAKFNLTSAQDDRTADMRAAGQVEGYLTGKSPMDFTGLSANKVAGFVNGRQSYAKGDLDMDSTRLGMDSTRLGMDVTRQGMAQNQWRFKNEQESYATTKAVEAATMGLDLNAFDAQSGEQWLRSQNFTPEVYNAIRGRIPALYSGGAGVSGAISGAIGGGGDPTRIITGGGKGNLGIGSLPDSVQTQGDAVNFGKMLNSRGQESSATGLYQITQSTRSEFGPKALGANWQNAPINAQADDAIAQKIFESTGGNPTRLKGRWTSLKGMDDAKLAQIAKGGWPAIRGLIAQGESGGDPNALLSNRFNASLGQTNKTATRNVDSIANDYGSAVNDQRPVGAVVNEMLKNSIYKGKTQNELLEMVQGVQAQAAAEGRPITAAMAAAILERNPESNRPGQLRRFGNTIASVGGLIDPFGWYSNKTTIEPKKRAVNDAVRSIADGRNDANMKANFNDTLVADASAAAQQQLAQADARLASARAAIASGKRVDLAPLIIAREAAFRTANGGSIAIAQDPDLALYGAPKMTPGTQRAWDAALRRTPLR